MYIDIRKQRPRKRERVGGPAGKAKPFRSRITLEWLVGGFFWVFQFLVGLKFELSEFDLF